MRILILGGTSFVGRHMAQEAIGRGHTVTVFHRGRTAAVGIGGVREILGDRTGDLVALRTEEWDAVLDTSGYLPRVVGLSASALAGVPRYLFVSTISVYSHPYTPSSAEEAVLATLADPSVETVDGETYGGLKVLCETVVREIFGTRATVLRPGLVAGPHDPTNRFTYWVARAARNGPLLAGIRPDQAMQIVDARDLAAFAVDCLERDRPGTYNVAGEASTMDQMLDACGVPPERVWTSAEQLAAVGVEPGKDLPLVIAGPDDLLRTDSSKAVAAGLRRRPVPETALATREWFDVQSQDRRDCFSLTPERESSALEALTK